MKEPLSLGHGFPLPPQLFFLLPSPLRFQSRPSCRPAVLRQILGDCPRSLIVSKNIDKMANNLQNLPIIGNIVKTVSDDAKKYSFQKISLRLINRLNGKLEIIGKTKEIESILKEKPIILVSNHPHDSDTIALIASLPERRDAYIIAIFTTIGIIPSLDKYMIPVYVRHHDIRKRNALRSFLKIFNPTPIFSPEEEHQKNIKSIEIAAKKIDSGGLVIIFPGTGYAKKWYPGIGHLIKNLHQKNAYLIKTYIQGTSNLDWFRLSPFLGKFFPPVKITLSKPREIRSLQTNSPKEITRILEKEYNRWANTL